MLKCGGRMRQPNGRAIEEAGLSEQFAAGRNTSSYPRRALVYTPEQPADDLLLLSSGQIGLHLISDEGRALTLRVVEPGQLLGQIALASAGNYDTFAEALTPVALYRIPREEALAIIEREPALGLALLEDLGMHRLTVSHLFDEVAFKSVPARL